MKKAILIVLAFAILGIVFFFSEERHEEGQTEISYWKINPEEIRYFPPKNNSEFSKFISSRLIFKKVKHIFYIIIDLQISLFISCIKKVFSTK